MKKIFDQVLKNHKTGLKFLEENFSIIDKVTKLFIETLESKGKVIFVGNGGSAADAQHLAAELVGRFKNNRQSLPALALSVNTSIITAIGNDFGFKEVFSRQIESLASPADLVVALSTSGKSANIIEAVKKAKLKKIKTVGFLGRDGGDLADLVDVALTIPLPDTPGIQEMHILAGHLICEFIDEHFS